MIEKYDQNSLIENCNQKMQFKCLIDSQVHEFASLQSSQVCRFESLKTENKQMQKTQFNELGQFENECSIINWCPGLDEPSDLFI